MRNSRNSTVEIRRKRVATIFTMAIWLYVWFNPNYRQNLTISLDNFARITWRQQFHIKQGASYEFLVNSRWRCNSRIRLEGRGPSDWLIPDRGISAAAPVYIVLFVGTVDASISNSYKWYRLVSCNRATHTAAAAAAGAAAIVVTIIRDTWERTWHHEGRAGRIEAVGTAWNWSVVPGDLCSCRCSTIPAVRPCSISCPGVTSRNPQPAARPDPEWSFRRDSLLGQ